MSPEQAQGMDVDSRTDIWALGCVLYEMVSGQRPFLGQYDQALLYEIVHEEPQPLTGLRTGVPVELELLVGECLTKEREDRTESAREVSRKLRTLSDKLRSGRSTILRTGQMTGAVPATMTGAHTLNPAATLPPDAVVMKRSSQRMLQALAALATLAFLATLALLFTQTQPERPVRRFSFAQPGLTGAAISPDGRFIAFVADTDGEPAVWLRAIGSETARQIPGTEGARPALAWSPDSRSIVSATTAQAKRIAIDGGEPLTLCDLPGIGNGGFAGVTWSPNGERIVFSSSGGRLYEIPARGGEPQALVDRGSGGDAASWPNFLPAGDGPQALVYRLGARTAGRIMVLNLETGASSEIGPGGEAVYSRQGYLIHRPSDRDEAGLFALHFSLASLQATGESFRIAEVGEGASVAADGTLIYLDGVGGTGNRTLVWRDRKGVLLETVGQPQPTIQSAALSPDGQRVAVHSTEAGNYDIWIHDLSRSTKTRLTFDSGSESSPAWSPSGDQIVYRQGTTDQRGASLMRKAADGVGEAVALRVESESTAGSYAFMTSNWSRDGRYVVYDKRNSLRHDGDIGYVEIGADGTAGEPMTFLDTPANEMVPKLSPDGRFVAYASDESGGREVYVRPFPNGAGRWQASVDGGGQPRWSRDGKELFYVQDNTLMSVSVSAGQGVVLGQPQQLFQSDDLLGFGVSVPKYDVSPDGQRFLMTSAVNNNEGEQVPPTIRVVQNWYEEFRNREQ
jgi:Tol biopolymer transport system component